MMELPRNEACCPPPPFPWLRKYLQQVGRLAEKAQVADVGTGSLMLGVALFGPRLQWWQRRWWWCVTVSVCAESTQSLDSLELCLPPPGALANSLAPSPKPFQGIRSYWHPQGCQGEEG